uniref:Mitochondrial carrier protein n=1 Tax=Macrostomum lignano TaxID=282301 RepID=A0A1I8HEP8_9PLAT
LILLQLTQNAVLTDTMAQSQLQQNQADTAAVSASHANLHFWQRVAASSIGGVATSLTMTPFDVVKTRMQAQARPKQFGSGNCFLYCNGLMDHLCMCAPETDKSVPWYRKPGAAKFTSPLDALLKIVRHEGPQSLYSGLSATLILAIPSTVIYFTSMDLLKAGLGYRPPNDTAGKAWVPPVAAVSARLVSVMCMSPLELTQRTDWSVVLRSASAEVRAHGLFSLWRGAVPTLLRDVPFSAIYWLTFDSARTARLRSAGADSLSLTEAAGLGGLAGLIAGLATLPFDVVKTHKQMELGVRAAAEASAANAAGNSSVWKAMRDLVKRGGLAALFTGVTPRLLKVVPASAIMVGSFECLKNYFAKMNATAGETLL